MQKKRDMQHSPITGGAAPKNAVRTAEKLAEFAKQFLPRTMGRGDMAGTDDGREENRKPAGPGRQHYLDVGCGNGFITCFLADAFSEVYGIDTEPVRLSEFQEEVAGRDHYYISRMPADRMTFNDGKFDFITSFEVLEHVSDLDGTADEITRVLTPGGVLVISVPQVWFPVENHGVRWRGRNIVRKIPLLPYLRPLHRRLALARVFSSGELETLFTSRGLEHLKTGYIAPQFERAGSRKGSIEYRLSFLRPFLNKLEKVPFARALIGVSMLMAFHKPSE